MSNETVEMTAGEAPAPEPAEKKTQPPPLRGLVASEPKRWAGMPGWQPPLWSHPRLTGRL
jgi:hypothetical protein